MLSGSEALNISLAITSWIMWVIRFISWERVMLWSRPCGLMLGCWAGEVDHNKLDFLCTMFVKRRKRGICVCHCQWTRFGTNGWNCTLTEPFYDWSFERALCLLLACHAERVNYILTGTIRSSTISWTPVTLLPNFQWKMGCMALAGCLSQVLVILSLCEF